MNLRTTSTALAVVAVAALWTCAGAAAGTFVTTTEGDVYTSTIKAESQGSFAWDGTIAVTCSKSSLEGTIESDGPEVPAKGKLSSLTFSECGNHTVTVVKSGTFEMNATTEGDGTLKSSGAEITVLTHSLFLGTRHCIYATSETELGTVTGSYPSEGNAAVDIGAPIPQSVTDGLCGNDAELTGSYKVSTPAVLSLAQAAAEPKITFTWEPGDIKEGKEKEVSVIENNSQVDYTLEKIELVSVGGMILEDAADCKGVKVEKNKGEQELCNVRLVCVKAPGEGTPRVRTFWSDKPVIRKTWIATQPVKCE